MAETDQNTPLPASPELDRDATPTVTGRRLQPRNFIIAGVLVVLIVGVLFVLKYVLFGDSHAPDVVAQKSEALESRQTDDTSIAAYQKRIEEDARLKAEQARQAEEDRRKKEEALREAEARRNEAKQKIAQLQAGNNPPAGNHAGNDAPRSNEKTLTPAQRRLLGSILSAGAEKTATSGAQSPGRSEPEIKSSSAIGPLLNTEEYAPARAEQIRWNPDYLLQRGSQLSCVLKTRIVTTYPGLVMCQLTGDVYSANGLTLLLRRGSMFFGEQKQAVVQGSNRLFVSWSSVDTPEHVTVRLDALGTDTLGASGLEGFIDTHDWPRFKNAIMLSLVKDTLATAGNVASNSNSNSSVTYDNSSDSVEDMATTALKRDINIPDTGYINQGALVNIFVPRNVDFSTVFENH